MAGKNSATKKKARKAKRRIPPARKQGLLISGADPAKISYAEICGRLKSGVDLEALGVSITEMCRTKSGAVAIAVGRGVSGAQAAEKLRVAVEAVLSSDAECRFAPIPCVSIC